ncbi:YkvA family protein [Kangiella sp. M94]
MSKLTKEEQERRVKEAEARFQESVSYIEEDDVQSAAKSGEEKVNVLAKAVPKSLKSLWSDIKLLIGVIKDYSSGEYREIPFGTIAVIAAAILYFVSPIDAIPDFIPGIGYIDDAAIIALCLRGVRKDLEVYKVWKEKQEM